MSSETGFLDNEVSKEEIVGFPSDSPTLHCPQYSTFIASKVEVNLFIFLTL